MGKEKRSEGCGGRGEETWGDGSSPRPPHSRCTVACPPGSPLTMTTGVAAPKPLNPAACYLAPPVSIIRGYATRSAMTADDVDATVRWQSIGDFYDDFVRDVGWESLRPMVDLTEWVGQQPWAANLFPSTTHAWLCVKLKPG